jgi:hypothetical protein
MKDNTPKPENYEYSKKIKYMDMEFDVVFKIDSNCDVEILCICENGLNFTTKKFNIKNSSLDFELFSELIKFDENWTLEGDITKDNFSIKLFKIIKLNFNLINLNENSEKIIRYLCQKVSSLTKEISELKNIKEEKIKEIPLTFTNGWGNYNSGYATGKIIKKGNEITLSGLIKGTNFSTVCVLPEDCRPKQVLIFTVNHHESTMRLDIYPNGNVTYAAGTNKHNWISLDGIHFFAGI